MDGEELLIMREDEILGIIERAGAAPARRWQVVRGDSAAF